MKPFDMLALATLALVGCDVAPNIKLYNGVGRLLVVDVAKGRRPPSQVRLEPGASVRVWNIAGSDLRLGAEGCERRYNLPEMELNHPWPIRDGTGRFVAGGYRYPVGLQIQPDFTLLLLPSDATGLRPEEDLKGRQAHGYPLRPAWTNCP